jgi:hypothetical protein
MSMRLECLQEEQEQYFVDRDDLMEKPLFETSFSFTVDSAPQNKTI